MSMTTDYRVRLVSVASVAQGISGEDTVIFNVTPQFVENREVKYNTMTPVHMPGGIQVFENSMPRTFSLTAKLISRTPEEATINMLYVQKLRGWTMPYFGDSSTTKNRASNKVSSEAKSDSEYSLSPDSIAKRLISSQRRQNSIDMLGAPPDVLYLYAYSGASNEGDSTGRAAKYGVNINKVPVVITSLSITYPEDVDYIPTFSNVDIRKSEPFPTKMDVSISLAETHSPREYEKFDLERFKKGQLSGF